MCVTVSVSQASFCNHEQSDNTATSEGGMTEDNYILPNWDVERTR